MEQFKSLIDFTKKYSDRDACLQYLVDQKWGEGYQCKKCGGTHAHKGRTWYYKKCAKCQYDESCTSGTLFHKLKFPIEKAFVMLYLLTTSKKGFSTCELARQFDITQKSAWFFKHKVQQAMQAEDLGLLHQFVEVDETLIGGQEKGKPGRSLGKKLPVQVAIETCTDDKGKQRIKRASAHILKGYNAEEILAGVESMVGRGAMVTTDGLPSYRSIEKYFGHVTKLSEKGSNFQLLHWHIFNLTNWIRGTHHHISSKHANSYLKEFNFKFNHRNYIKDKVKDVMENMVLLPWLPFKVAIGN